MKTCDLAPSATSYSDGSTTAQQRSFLRLIKPLAVLEDNVFLAVAEDFTKNYVETTLRAADRRGAERRPRTRHSHRRHRGLVDHSADLASRRRACLRSLARIEPARPSPPAPVRGSAPQPALHVRHLRHRRLQPLCSRRGAGRRREPRQDVQPALHLRRLRTGQDAPASRDRPLHASDQAAEQGAVRELRGVHQRLHQLDPRRPLAQLQEAIPRGRRAARSTTSSSCKARNRRSRSSSTPSTPCTTPASTSSSRPMSRPAT